jgi:flagellar protein FliS
MRMGKRAVEAYGTVKLQAEVAENDRVGLIRMMFDALIDSLVVAQGQIERRDLAGKSASLSRASRIVLGLQSALDFEKGGELARNLDELYGYVNRRLVQANASNDLSVIAEVKGLMAEIRDAWATIQPPVDVSKLAA